MRFSLTFFDYGRTAMLSAEHNGKRQAVTCGVRCRGRLPQKNLVKMRRALRAALTKRNRHRVMVQARS